MAKILFILAISLGSLVVGYLVRRAGLWGKRVDLTWPETLSRRMKIWAIFILNPVPIIDSFWRLSLSTKGIFMLPLLGVLSLLVGGISAIVLSRLFRIPPKRAASVFTSGMFTNILTFGGLISFVFFGYRGYAFVQLFNMFVSMTYYVVGFPLSREISIGGKPSLRALSPKAMRERPYMFVPIITMAAGLLLNLTGVPRPLVFDWATNALIPIIAGMLGASIGLTLRLSTVGNYRLEIPLIAAIKFIIVPAIIIPLGIAFGLPAVADGLAFKVLVVVSVMPVAFNALVPPAMYGFDLDLANSAWIVTTLSLALILPLLYLVLQPR
ncbi:MAG TPA: hypothetical protein VMW73_08340 [Spirochaetia bacterium]|nr:hypothetical protein [Spirochaetia bacterium]